MTNPYFRCYEEINLDAVHKNMEAISKKVGDDTGLLAVVKADGYGHGAVPVARAVEDLCYGYAVATAAEGHNLRRHNITKPIFVLGYVPGFLNNTLIDYDLIPAIFSYDSAKSLSDAAALKHKIAKINIAIDTGMNRIGYRPVKESRDEILRISRLPGISIESIFTHFATADSADKSSANIQLQKFCEFVDSLSESGIDIPIHQCANSAAAMEMKDSVNLPGKALNLARIGISMYGIYPSDEVDRENVPLIPAMSLYSHVISVKNIGPGEGISYGYTYVSDKPMEIATISIGYGDGYPRNLSNCGEVLIKGQKAKITGRVCMDQFMVDVTGMGVKEGDLVTLIGKDKDLEITVDDTSSLAGTFPYEFVCNIGKRVPRVYLKNNQVIATKDYENDDYDTF